MARIASLFRRLRNARTLFIGLAAITAAVLVFGIVMRTGKAVSGDYIYLTAGVLYVGEDEGMAVVPVERSYQSKPIISCMYISMGDTAKSYSDFTPVFGSMPLAENEAGAISISIIDDDYEEGNETLYLSLNGSYVLNDPANGCYSSCEIIIVDDDGIQPPELNISSGGFSAPMGTVIEIGGEIVFAAPHSVTIDDGSTGSGWRLHMIIDETISFEGQDPDDPSIAGNGLLGISIPSMEWLDGITIDSITYPDSSCDETDVSLDLSSAVFENGVYRLEVLNVPDGNGVHIIELDIAMRIGSWLPEGTVVIPEGSTSRFDGNPVDPGINEMVLGPDSGIQVFSWEYSLVISYEIERISQP